MKGLENQVYLIAYIISNAFALILAGVSFKWPKLARLLFFVLFLWASWTNWTTALKSPHFYLDYADLTFLNVYQQFIQGWFSRHILLAVGFIATAQALIAVSMLLKSWVYKLGVTGAITFLVSIFPLGAGSAFPCTLIMSVALVLLWHQDAYVWQPLKGKYVTH